RERVLDAQPRRVRRVHGPRDPASTRKLREERIMPQVSEKARNDMVDHYEREGYVLAHRVLDEDLVEEARRHIDWLLERNPGVRPEQLHHELMQDDPFWVRLISDPRLLDVAQAFIGPDIAL